MEYKPREGEPFEENIALREFALNKCALGAAGSAQVCIESSSITVIESTCVSCV